MTEAAATFTILTIGDGLVSQIPALIVATATGIVATRTTRGEEENFATNLVKQLTDKSKTLVIVGFIMFIFSLAPNFPTPPLIFVAFTFWFAAWLINRENENSFFTKFNLSGIVCSIRHCHLARKCRESVTGGSSKVATRNRKATKL